MMNRALPMAAALLFVTSACTTSTGHKPDLHEEHDGGAPEHDGGECVAAGCPGDGGGQPDGDRGEMDGGEIEPSDAGLDASDADVDTLDADIDTDADVDTLDADIDGSDAEVDALDADVDASDATVDTTDADVAAPDAGEVDAGSDAGTELTTYYVVEATNVDARFPGASVYLFEPATGVIDESSEQVSALDGRVVLPSRAGAGFFVRGDGLSTQDTWNYPPSALGEDALIRVASVTSALVVPLIADFEAQANSGPVAGRVLWRNPSSGTDEPVGCATLDESPSVGDIRMFDGVLPTSPSNRDPSAGTVPANDSGTNPGEAGWFYVGNVAAGLRTLTARVNGTVVGSTTLFVRPRADGTPINSGAGSNLSLASIWVDGAFASNPTPADCE